MKELKGVELADILQERQSLKAELESRQITEVFWLNSTPTTPEAERTAKKTLILLARRQGQSYIIMDTVKKGGDSVLTWLHDGSELASNQQGAGFIVIDKSKVGRPARVISDAERQEIRDRHKNGESINAIAKAMHIGTRRVMAAMLRMQEENESEKETWVPQPFGKS